MEILIVQVLGAWPVALGIVRNWWRAFNRRWSNINVLPLLWDSPCHLPRSGSFSTWCKLNSAFVVFALLWRVRYRWQQESREHTRCAGSFAGISCSDALLAKRMARFLKRKELFPSEIVSDCGMQHSHLPSTSREFCLKNCLYCQANRKHFCFASLLICYMVGNWTWLPRMKFNNTKYEATLLEANNRNCCCFLNIHLLEMVEK